MRQILEEPGYSKVFHDYESKTDVMCGIQILKKTTYNSAETVNILFKKTQVAGLLVQMTQP